MQSKRQFYYFILLIGLFLSGCRATRYVPDGKYLLNDIDYKIDTRQINKEELSSYVQQEENLKILGFFKFHLWLYNLSKTDKEKSWFREIGEPPVIYDDALNQNSVLQIKQYLYHKGFYESVVNDSVVFKKKRAYVTYSVKAGTPYLIRNIAYAIRDTVILHLVEGSQEDAIVHAGDILDVDLLDDERTRITKLLNNNGYYLFMADYIHFNIDSTLSTHKADIKMVIENPSSSTDPSREMFHRKYYISDYSISVLHPQKNLKSINLQALNDTVSHEGILYRFNTKIPIHAGTIAKTLDIKPGDLYSKLKEERTYNNLYSLRQFKYVNIQFQENEQYADSTNGMLSGRIILPLQVGQNYSFDIEGTNTSGDLGIAGNLNYQHRNIFRGGEIFDLSFKGATERIQSQKMKFTKNELGVTAKLSIPGLILPGNEKRFKLHTIPFTTFSSSYSYQEYPKYTRTIVNLGYGYNWKTRPTVSHSLNVVDLNLVDVLRINADFFDSIKDSYIRSGFTDHIVSASSYSVIYNTQNSPKRPDYKYFRLNVEAAGNSLWLLSNLTGQELNEPVGTFADTIPYYKIFDTRFAQYIKSDVEIRYGYRFDKYNLIASRAFVGVAVPYGNFPVTPPEKCYYSGGANGVRAWPVRTLGPGSYVSGLSDDPNQYGDIKIEANIEYRFKFFWMLEGALFLDAGNVWAINQNDTRSGAVFQFNSFYDEIAVGTGLGLRLVTNYFILRADTGLKLRDPERLSGQRWIPGNRAFKTSDINFNIAIGYPF